MQNIRTFSGLLFLWSSGELTFGDYARMVEQYLKETA
jgi:hypothetical protein